MSRLRSATSFLSVLFSSSCNFSRRISQGNSPPYLSRQMQNVTSLMPALWQTSPIAVPSFARHNTKAIYAA